MSQSRPAEAQHGRGAESLSQISSGNIFRNKDRGLEWKDAVHEEDGTLLLEVYRYVWAK